jgi:hypothetical protein
VGLVCRLLEERGIATVYVATGRDLAQLVMPPRVLFVNHPMGNIFGGPHDVDMQRHILRAVLELIESATTGGELVDFPSEWPTPFEFAPGGPASANAAAG